MEKEGAGMGYPKDAAGGGGGGVEEGRGWREGKQ